MRNRGNGKGGGIAAAGLVPEQLGVDAKTLRDDYIIQIALLDTKAAGDVEKFMMENLPTWNNLIGDLETEIALN